VTSSLRTSGARAFLATALVISTLLAIPAAQAAETDEYIVVLANDTAVAAQSHSMALGTAVQITHVFDEVLGGFAVQASPNAAAALANDPRIAAVVPSQTFSLTEIANWGFFRIDALEAHDVANGLHRGAGTRIIVIDSGVDLDHPDLESNLDLSSGTNCINPGSSPADDVDHGTHVAGIAAARYGPDGYGVVGIAPEATVVPIKAFDQTGNATTAQVLCGINHAKSVANDGYPTVVNMSFGETGSDSVCDDAGTDVIHEAICDLADTGAILVAGAGNSLVDTATFIPAAFDETIAVSSYADFDGIPGGLAGCRFGSDFSYDCDDTFSDFSNWGESVDVMAPGSQIYSSVPNDTHAVKSGTSMAAPQVSGVVALMLAADPTLTQNEARALLQDTGECPDTGINSGGAVCLDQGAWTDDPDGSAEPLINALRAAQRATDPVRWISPRPGLMEPGITPVAIKVAEDSPGTTTVSFDVDGGTSQPTSYNAATGYYEGSWDASGLLTSGATLSAHADDGSGVETDMIAVAASPQKQAHWSFDETTGLVAADISGNGWNAELVNGPVWTGGLYDGAISLDGADDYLNINNSLLNGVGDATIATWVKPAGAGTHTVLSGANSQNSNEILLIIKSATEVRFFSGEDSASRESWNVPSLVDGAWHHLAFVRNASGDSLELYLDGVSQGSRSTPVGPLAIAADGLIVGQEQDSIAGGFDADQAFDGLLDDYFVFDRVLTAQEVADLADLPEDLTPPTAVDDFTAVADGLAVNLAWSAASDGESGVSAYRIYRDTSGGGAKALLAEIPASELAYVDTATDPLTTYFYEMAAVNGSGLEGPLSPEQNATTAEGGGPGDPHVIGYWSLDETAGTVAADGSNSGNDGTVVGSASWTSGRINGGLTLGTSTDLVDIPSAALDGADTITIALWTKLNSGGTNALVSAANPGNNNELLMNLKTPSQLRFFTGEAANSRVDWSLPSLDDGQWHHLAVVRDSVNNEVEVFLDGQSRGSQATPLRPLDVANGGLVFGEEQDSVGGGFDSSQALDGALDEVWFYNRVLTVQEIEDLALYVPDTTPPSAPGNLVATANGLTVDLTWEAATDAGSGVAGYTVDRSPAGSGPWTEIATPDGAATSFTDAGTLPATTYYYRVTAVDWAGNVGDPSNTDSATTDDANSSLIGHWELDETTGTVAADSSTYDRDATLKGSPTWSAGIIGGGLHLDPNSDYLKLKRAILNGADTLTVAMWMKADSTGTHTLISGANSGNSNEILLLIKGDDEIRFFTGQKSNSLAKWAVPSMTDGEWHHVAVVRDSVTNKVELFVDGVSYGNKSKTLLPLDIAAGGLMIGQEQDSVGGGFSVAQALDGYLDDVRIYDRPLTSAEIAALATP